MRLLECPEHPSSLILSLSCFCCAIRASLMGLGLTSELCWASIIKYAVYHTTGRSVSLPNEKSLHLLVCVWTLWKILLKCYGTFKRWNFSPSNWYIRWMESKLSNQYQTDMNTNDTLRLTFKSPVYHHYYVSFWLINPSSLG